MIDTEFESLVSTEWLAVHLQSPGVKVIDGSWYLPKAGRDAEAEYRAGHIPGAVFFDIDEIADSDDPLPHMLPSVEKFTSRMRTLGLGDGDRMVVYDGTGLMSVARVWWTFRVFGHEDVAVLNGGLPKWRAEGRSLVSGNVVPQRRHFTAVFEADRVSAIDDVRINLASGGAQIVDARSRGRFHGEEPEPRSGLRAGHIPRSLNIPYTDLIDPADGTLLPVGRLRRIFREAGIDLDKPVIASCGSGISAAVVAFALDRLGHSQVAVYDGSWAEWGGLPDTPVDR